mgnify:CR=1 FL=1
MHDGCSTNVEDNIQNLKILLAPNIKSDADKRLVVICSKWMEGKDSYELIMESEGTLKIDKGISIDDNVINYYNDWLCKPDSERKLGRLICDEIAYYLYDGNTYSKCDKGKCGDLDKEMPKAFKNAFNYRACPDGYDYRAKYIGDLTNVCVKSVCNGVSINLYTDNDNCGTCGKKCENTTCVNGKCDIVKGNEGLVLCDGKYINPNTSTDHCGAKGNCSVKKNEFNDPNYAGEKCPENRKFCTNGRCNVECVSGQIVCDEQCVNPLTDIAYCGARGKCNNDASDDKDYKGVACAEGYVCSDGNCGLTCAKGQIKCGSKCIDPLENKTYCGAKGTCEGDDEKQDNFKGEICEEGSVCSEGKCSVTCVSGQIVCNGKCIDPKADNTYCGAKGVCNNDSTDSENYKGATCTNGRVCSNGSCDLTCETGKIICDNKCVDPKADNIYCGAKAGCTGATQCSGVTPLCSGGKCVSTCIGNQIVCGDRCVDPSSDNSYCGAKGACNNDSISSTDYKGATCRDGRICSNGTCALTCETGKIICNNKCVDPKTDNTYCGAKGVCNNDSTDSENYKGATCKDGRVCSKGTCALTCETGKIICDNKCVDPKTDNTYCGAKEGCTEAKKCSGVTPLCYDGKCVSTCVGNQIVCGGRCVDPSSDNSYCGAKGACNDTSTSSTDYKGATCRDGRICSNGTCALTCETGKIICDNKCVDPKADNLYCGAKGKCNSASVSDANYRGKECADGTKCTDRVCEISCVGDQIACDGECIDPKTNPYYCGATGDCKKPNHGTNCTNSSTNKLCAGGKCTSSCPTGQTQCDGFCINLVATNVESCTNDNIKCKVGYGNCDNDVANGCEIDTNNDNAHCRVCGNACTKEKVEHSQSVQCSSGACKATSCESGYKLQNGTCVPSDTLDCCGDKCTNCYEVYPNMDEGKCVSSQCVLESCKGGYTPDSTKKKCVEIECSSDTECGDSGECKNRQCKCGNNPACLGNTPICNNNGQCVACTSETHCPSKLNYTVTCNNNTCDYQCKTGYHNENGGCVKNTPDNCGSDGKCENDTPYCEENKGRCVKCTSKSHCSTNGSGVCDTDTNTCVYTSCKDGFTLSENHDSCVPTKTRCGTSATDCTMIPNILNADSVSCDNGFCKVTLCKPDSNTHVYNPLNEHGQCEANNVENCGEHGNKCEVEAGSGQTVKCDASPVQCKYSCADEFTDCSSASTSSETENGSLICLQKGWRSSDLTKDECKSCVNGGCKTGETCKRIGAFKSYSYSCQ